METRFSSKHYMNHVYVEAFNNQTFNQEDDENATLKIRYYNPLNSKIQRLPAKE